LTLIILAIGFPLAIIFSWIFDLSPEGVQKTKPATEVRRDEKKHTPNSWKIATYVSAVVIITLLAFNIFGGRGGAKIDESLDKSIAVLPFLNLMGDPEQEHICVGLTDEIISHLFKVRSFDEVRSLTSVRSYKDSEKSTTEIAEALRVNYILVGSFKRIGDNMRVTAQLIEPKSDKHIWLKDYDLPYKEVIGIPAIIAIQIADHLKVFIKSEEKERIENEPTENIEAYNLYLQGRYYWSQEGKDDLDKSIDYYKRALEIDPNYALAYSGMATTYNSYAWFGYSPQREFIPQAKEAAMKALELDYTLGEAHTELAFAQLIYDWDWLESEMEFKRALELNPNYARAHDLYAWLLTGVGRHDEAIKQSKRAHELDPLSAVIWVNLGRRYYFARDYDKAIEEYRKVLELYPNSKYSSISWYARSCHAMALSLKGLHNEAIEEYLKAEFELSFHFHLGYIYGVAGERDKALEILDFYLEKFNTDFLLILGFAYIYSGIGETDKAIEWLEKMYEQRAAWMTQLKVDPMFDSIRSDPGFRDLVERMNFPDN